MTRMMVRINDAAEAAQAASAGIDQIELTFPRRRPDEIGALSAVRSIFPGRLRLRLDNTDLTPELVDAAATMRADEIALALDRPSPPPSVRRERGLDIVARLATASGTFDAVDAVRHMCSRVDCSRVDGVMLEAGLGTRIVDSAGIAELDTFASACRAEELPFGLSGNLEAPDVSRLLLLQPDVLGFDAAVRAGHDARGPLDTRALRAVRGLIPRHDGAADRPERNPRAVVDRIFVRDFVVALSIGAYQAEHGKRQRVRFSVEAELSRQPLAPRDMRDVFSYDIIVETIRVLAERSHVTFVETLAEEIAAALLAHPALLATTVIVEKLDVIEGSVGIEIHRRRQA